MARLDRKFVQQQDMPVSEPLELKGLVPGQKRVGAWATGTQVLGCAAEQPAKHKGVELRVVDQIGAEGHQISTGLCFPGKGQGTSPVALSPHRP